QLAAGSSKGRRGDRLALAAVGAGPDGAVHAVQGHWPATSVANGYADLDVQLHGLGDRSTHDLVRFVQSECPVSSPDWFDHGVSIAGWRGDACRGAGAGSWA